MVFLPRVVIDLECCYFFNHPSFFLSLHCFPIGCVICTHVLLKASKCNDTDFVLFIKENLTAETLPHISCLHWMIKLLLKGPVISFRELRIPSGACKISPISFT